jgi:ribosome recycling factor
MSDTHHALVRVGISQGDFNGIGYEVIIKTFQDHGMLELCTPIIYGITKAASTYRKTLENQDFNFYGIPDASKAVKHHCNLINLTDIDVGMDPGKATPASGAWAVKSLATAVEDLEKGLIDVLVTAPINKHNVQSPDFNFPGHTEFLAARTQTNDYLMLLVSDGLRVGTVTGHIPIQQVASVTTPDARTLTIKPWERNLINEIERSIINSDLGLAPQNNGEIIILTIPPMTEERRRNLVKQAKNECESGKISIRTVRKETNELLRKLQKEGASEDEIKRAEDAVQKFTDSYSSKIDELLVKKEHEIMTV